MTREEAITIIKTVGYMSCEEDDYPEGADEAIDMAMEALAIYPRFKWERDTAISQLEEYGIGFAEKKRDLVEVVRCKDCRHAYYADNRVPHERTWVCERFTNEEINANDFCSFGERSE